MTDQHPRKKLMPKVKFSLLTRLQFAFLAMISPQLLVTAITDGFLSAFDSLEEDELRLLVKEISNEN